MKTKNFIANRLIIENEISQLRPFVSLVNNYYAITQRTNDALLKSGQKAVKNNTVYRMFVRSHLPKETECWAIINATKQYIREIDVVIKSSKFVLWQPQDNNTDS